MHLKVEEQIDYTWSSENRLFNILPWISGLILPLLHGLLLHQWLDIIIFHKPYSGMVFWGSVSNF